MTNIIFIAIATCAAIVLGGVGMVFAFFQIGEAIIKREIKVKRYKLK